MVSMARGFAHALFPLEDGILSRLVVAGLLLDQILPAAETLA
jgi:hypothetical protein